MKMLPIPLSLGGPPLDIWNNVLWRYPPAPPSPLAELKTQLPPQLPPDPRLWNRNDVTVFLRFCEREFDLPKFELDLFQMNGKALCLLNRTDFGERCPGAGDVLHNVLQMLMRESQMMHRHLPSSPVTPTSRYPLSPHSQPPTPNWAQLAPPESPFHNAHLHHFMQPNSVTLSPAPSIDSQASSPPQSNAQEQQPNASSTSSSSSSSSTSSSSSLVSGSMNGTNSNNGINTSIQQQQQQQQQQNSNNVFSSKNNNGTINSNISQINPTSSSSNQSDSDDENFNCNNNINNSNSNNSSALPTSTTSNSNVSTTTNSNSQNNKHHHQQHHHHHHQQQPPQLPMQSSPPPTPTLLKDIKPSLSQQLTNVMNSWSQQNHSLQIKNENPSSGSVSAPSTPGYMPVKREFFPDTPEPNTNGRLLWDFLQQLLNDPAQRYSNYIAWKCRDTGVFKIVDPAGLAKLWGIQKNHLSMNYDKMSRALRYYYRVNILRKVQGERHCYQFLRNPSELKNIKNISLLRQSVANSTSNIPSSPSATSATSNNQSNSNNKLDTQNTQQNQHHQQQQHNQHPNSDSRHSPIHMAQSSPHHLSAVHHHHQLVQHQQQNGTNNSNQLGLPNLSQISSTSPVSAYGQPPTSPHFLHAIQDAFFAATLATQQQQQQQQQQGQYQPPHSPALPPTPSEKLQFSSLKIESNSNDGNDDIQPTDLSVPNGERRWNENYNNFADCYPLIRNSDGCTTIKLIRYQENGSPSPSGAGTTTGAAASTSSPSSSSPNGTSATTPPSINQPHSPSAVSNGDNRLHSTTSNSSRHSPSLSPHSNTSEDVNVDEMPTDLSK